MDKMQPIEYTYGEYCRRWIYLECILMVIIIVVMVILPVLATKAVTSDSHANSLRNAFKHENRVMGRSNSNSSLSKAVSETVEAEKNVIEVGADAINNVTSSAVPVMIDELR